jgi:hypothetical protein
MSVRNAGGVDVDFAVSGMMVFLDFLEDGTT